MRMIAVILALVTLAGCATQTRRAPQGPPAYRQGFAAGCDSGYVAAGHPYYRFNKDHAQYATAPLYKSGWDDGFAVCKGKYESIQRMM